MIASLNIQEQWEGKAKTSEDEFGAILSELDYALSPIELSSSR